MASLIRKGVWMQYPRREGTVALGTKRLYSRKIRKHGKLVTMVEECARSSRAWWEG